MKEANWGMAFAEVREEFQFINFKNMLIDYQTTNFKADQKLLDFVGRKLSKLERLHSRIINATVYLKVENSEDKQNKTVEIKINSRDFQLFVSEQGRSFEAAVEFAMDSLRNQLAKKKTRVVATR